MELLRRHGPALGLLAQRFIAGSLMIALHGWPKLSAFSTKAQTFSDPLGVGSTTSLALAVFAEVVCALLVVVGAFTRLAVVPLLFTMAVAFFVVHGDDPWKKKELAAVYFAVFLPLLFSGAGPWSVDGLLRRRGP